MAKVLEDAKMFWNIDSVDPEDESDAKAVMKKVKNGMTVYLALVFLTGSVALVIPLVFSREKMLPFKVWIPDKENFSYGFEVNNPKTKNFDMAYESIILLLFAM